MQKQQLTKVQWLNFFFAVILSSSPQDELFLSSWVTLYTTKLLG